MEKHPWINPEKVTYFDLGDFVDKIKLSESVKSNLSYTDEMFENYIKQLSHIYESDLDSLVYAWLDQGIKEQLHSNRIENHTILFSEMTKADWFFEKLSMDHTRIKKIHKFVCDKGTTHGSIIGDYRKQPASVGTFNKGKYILYWNGAEVNDVKKFMDSFIDFYETNKINSKYNNPFIKAALAHLLFVRIHPFGDGNGRTARIIQNITFTNGINKIYGTKLKLSPLNVSQCIEQTKEEYVDILNRIHFNLNYDNNELINRWLRYMLYKYQEQINFQESRLGKINEKYKIYLQNTSPKSSTARDMKMKKLIK